VYARLADLAPGSHEPAAPARDAVSVEPSLKTHRA
jgi:hypothetical protein